MPQTERSRTMNVVKLSTPAVQSFYVRVTELNPTNFYTMYKNDYRLTCWNRNYDIPIRFETLACRMNHYRQTAAESRYIFHFLPNINLKLLDRFSPNFYTMYISAAMNARIYKVISHSVSERHSKTRRLQKRSQIQLVTTATSPRLPRNFCQFCNPHTYVYQW